MQLYEVIVRTCAHWRTGSTEQRNMYRLAIRNARGVRRNQRRRQLARL